MGENALHLARADHARLVDHQHVTRSQKVAPLRPAMFHAGDSARGDAGTILQPLRRDAGQRRAAHFESGALPCLARNAQHRALARSGVSHNHAEAAPVRYMLERRALLAGQRQPAPFHLRQCGGSVLPVHVMPFPLGHQLAGAL